MHFKIVFLDSNDVQLHSPRTYWYMFGKEPQRWLKDWALSTKELKEQGLFSLEVSQEGLVNLYTYLIGGSKEYRVRIFTVLPSQRTRGSRHKLKYKSFFLNVRKNIFTVTVVNTRASHPEGLCSLHPWRYSKITWAGQSSGLFLPTSTVLLLTLNLLSFLF